MKNAWVWTLICLIAIATGMASAQAPAQGSSALADALAASERPRDWALAAVVLNAATDDAGHLRRVELFGRAAAAAPDDVLVHWLIALSAQEADEKWTRLQESSERSLTRIDPDNGASWLPALTRAQRQGDAAQLDAALAGIAASRRYDDRYVGMMRVWLDVYRRYPGLNELFSEPSADAADLATQALVSAMGRTGTGALPPAQGLVSVCKSEASAPSTARRRIDCETIGRLMLERGSSLLSRGLGFALLRNLQSVRPADAKARLDVDWLVYNLPSTSALDGSSTSRMSDAFNDWLELGDESEIVRRALRRRGLPATAPEGWTRPRDGNDTIPPPAQSR